ncbi:glycine oxidase ThiO [Cohnella thailandensis]|uniref:glycine oxidase n=1 Tax=Cohnella thailandensis TaxID=557557 RepID=A0A841SR64_9BACL|nr:glycine oxidase ThiO [Cohnella thailandensis]MBB6633692.1 glycine oxidase ThiO [Cohnella thailandensis]MBP1976477.1 glycine oxidase [Cohnella thailandensis]
MKPSVLIVGGGIIGLSCAFEAASRGFAVTVLERDGFGGQASGAAAGMLAPFSENPDGPDAFFRLCLDSLRLYPEWARRVEEASGRRVEFLRTGSLQVALHEADELPLARRMEWQRPFGSFAERLSGEALRKLEPGLTGEAVSALYCPEEGHVHAPKLVEALELACLRAGVRLVAGAGELLRAEADESSGVRVTAAAAGRHAADLAVWCTGAWSGLHGGWLGAPVPVHPIRGQICAYRPLPCDVRHMIFTSQAYWVRKSDGSLVCGASEDVAGFDRSVTEAGIGRLVRWTGKMFPDLRGTEPARRWAGLRPATLDGWPLLGPLASMPGVFLAAGHYRNGILLSPATAAAACDWLEGRVGRTDGRLEPFSPERFSGARSGS